VWIAALWVAAAAGRPAALDDPAGVAYPIVAATAYAVVAAVLLARLPRLMGAPLGAAGLRPISPADGGAIAAGTLAVIVLRLSTFGYLAAIGQAGHVQAGLAGFRPTSAVAAVLTVLVGATIAPFSEELLFRGTVYRAIAVRMPDGRAVIASALIFAASRFDLVLAPFFVLYGTLLAALYRRSGNLFVPIGVRAIFDGLSYALLIWLG
jgi:uncharacterized protein